MKSTIDGIGAGSNLKFNNIKGKYEKDEDEMKVHVFDNFFEEYKSLHVYFNVNISKMVYKDLNKGIFWFWKT